MRKKPNKIRKSLKTNSQDQNNKLNLITNLNLLTKLLTKKKNYNLENSSKQEIKSYLGTIHNKKIENLKEKEILIKDESYLLKFLFDCDFIKQKNEIISYHHGIKNLKINLYDIKRFIKFIHKIFEKNKKRKYNMFFERLMMLKLKENLKINFLNNLNQIILKKSLNIKKKGLQNIKSYSLVFDIYNEIYDENEYQWKKGVMNILKDFDRRPKTLFSIANKNPFYFKFLVFFKQIDLMKKKREKVAFDLLKKLNENKKKLEEVKSSRRSQRSLRQSQKKIFSKRKNQLNKINQQNNLENSDYTNSLDTKEKTNTQYNKNIDEEENLDKRLTKSYKYIRKFKNNQREEPPNHLIEENSEDEDLNDIKDNKKYVMNTQEEFGNEEYVEYIQRNKNRGNNISNEEFQSPNNFTFQKKVNKLNGGYEENFNNMNYRINPRDEDVSVSKQNFRYKRTIAKRINKEYLVKKTQKEKKKSSKMIFLILKEMVLKRNKNSFFKIQKVKRVKKTEKILYAKVKLLKRPIQYTMEVNQDDLRSMNIPIPNNQLRINKSQPNFFEKSNNHYNSMSFMPPYKNSYENINVSNKFDPGMFRSQIHGNNFTQRQEISSYNSNMGNKRQISSYIPNMGTKRSFEMNRKDLFLRSNKRIFLKKNKNNNTKSSHKNLIFSSTKNFASINKKNNKDYSGQKFLNRFSQVRMKTENDKY